MIAIGVGELGMIGSERKCDWSMEYGVECGVWSVVCLEWEKEKMVG